VVTRTCEDYFQIKDYNGYVIIVSEMKISFYVAFNTNTVNM